MCVCVFFCSGSPSSHSTPWHDLYRAPCLPEFASNCRPPRQTARSSYSGYPKSVLPVRRLPSRAICDVLRQYRCFLLHLPFHMFVFFLCLLLFATHIWFALSRLPFPVLHRAMKVMLRRPKGRWQYHRAGSNTMVSTPWVDTRKQQQQQKTKHHTLTHTVHAWLPLEDEFSPFDITSQKDRISITAKGREGRVCVCVCKEPAPQIRPPVPLLLVSFPWHRRSPFPIDPMSARFDVA